MREIFVSIIDATVEYKYNHKSNHYYLHGYYWIYKITEVENLCNLKLVTLLNHL